MPEANTDRLMSQLDVQISQRDLEELFKDGRPHTLTFLDAIFVDGLSLSTPAHQPTVFHAEADSLDAFNEAMNNFMDCLTKAHRDAVYENLLMIRACGLAGMVLAAEMLEKQAQPTKRLNDAFSLLGTALGVPRDCWEGSMLLPGVVATKFREYLDSTEPPDISKYLPIAKEGEQE